MKFVKIAMGIVALLIVIGTFVQQMGTTKANARVDEANASIAQADEHVNTAAKKYDELFTEANIDAFPGNREQFKKLAEEIVEHAKQGSKHFGDAAGKFAEASKDDVGKDAVSEYWKLKGQVNEKFSQGILALADGAGLFLDESIVDATSLKEKVIACTGRLTQNMDDGKAINVDAEKIKAANKDKFKQD